MERVCERCAGDDDDLVVVRPADTGADEGATPQLWCFPCRSTAEHVMLDDG